MTVKHWNIVVFVQCKKNKQKQLPIGCLHFNSWQTISKMHPVRVSFPCTFYSFIVCLNLSGLLINRLFNMYYCTTVKFTQFWLLNITFNNIVALLRLKIRENTCMRLVLQFLWNLNTVYMQVKHFNNYGEIINFK